MVVAPHLHVGHVGFFGVMAVFYLLIVVVATQLYRVCQNYEPAHFEQVLLRGGYTSGQWVLSSSVAEKYELKPP